MMFRNKKITLDRRTNSISFFSAKIMDISPRLGLGVFYV